jgi:hypothetical protein
MCSENCVTFRHLIRLPPGDARLFRHVQCTFRDGQACAGGGGGRRMGGTTGDCRGPLRNEPRRGTTAHQGEPVATPVQRDGCWLGPGARGARRGARTRAAASSLRPRLRARAAPSVGATPSERQGEQSWHGRARMPLARPLYWLGGWWRRKRAAAGPGAGRSRARAPAPLSAVNTAGPDSVGTPCHGGETIREGPDGDVPQRGGGRGQPPATAGGSPAAPPPEPADPPRSCGCSAGWW